MNVHDINTVAQQSKKSKEAKLRVHIVTILLKPELK